MPTIQATELPRPKNWQDFETIVLDAMIQRWTSPNLQKNGRAGQAQSGIDIYGPDDIGRRVGIQCKRYKGPLSLKVIEAEVAAAENFKGPLTTLYIATTSEHDAKLQREARLLSDKRVAAGKFAVSLLFWDEIVGALLLNPAVFQSHYPQMVLPSTAVTDRERQLAALELGYYGGELWKYVVLIYGEYGRMAQVDPDTLIATLETLERRVSQLLPPHAAAPIIRSLVKVRKGCLARKKAKSDWDPVEAYAKRIQTRLGKASALLPPSDARMLELALQLGRIYHHADDLPSRQTRARIENMVRSLLPGSSSDAITSAFAAARKRSSGYEWATRLYNLLDHELRWAEL